MVLIREALGTGERLRPWPAASSRVNLRLKRTKAAPAAEDEALAAALRSTGIGRAEHVPANMATQPSGSHEVLFDILKVNQ